MCAGVRWAFTQLLMQKAELGMLSLSHNLVASTRSDLVFSPIKYPVLPIGIKE